MSSSIINKDMPILVVDDSTTVQEAVINVLRDLGFKNFMTANDGVDGMSAYQRSYEKDDPIQFIISDIQMPNMTGIEFLKAIRKDNPDVPVLMLTSESDQKTVLEAITSGASNYQLKPFKSDDIAEKLISIMVAKAKGKQKPKKDDDGGKKGGLIA
jgi:two-component system chemotaxis response regulator CheY